MEKRKVIISYDKLPPQVIEAIGQQYPTGYEAHIRKITNHKSQVFFVVPVETNDTYYLVKVKVDRKNVNFEKEIRSLKSRLQDDRETDD